MNEGEQAARRVPGGVSLTIWIAATCLLVLAPMLAFSAAMIYHDIANQQRQGLQGLGRRAATAAAAVGHELEEVLAELSVLSLADSARKGDLRATYELAVRLADMDPRVETISLSARSGRPSFITSRPFGTELPDSKDTALQQALFEGAQRAVSPLLLDETGKQPVIGVGTRVDLGPAGIFALRATVRLEAIAGSLNRQDWPADWTAAVIDQNGIILARSRDAQRYAGQPSTPGLLENVRRNQGAFHAFTKDGIATVACGAAVPGTGWYVVVGRPADALAAQVRESMATILLVGGLCALLGIGVAAYTARSIGGQLRRVVDAHVRGRPDSGPVTGVKEVREIADALAASRAAVSDVIAELNTARENALAQLRERDETLDVLAHEVRQPLNNASAALQEANAAILSSAVPGIRAPLSRANSVLSEVLASIDNTLAAASLLVGDKPMLRVDFDIDALVKVIIADMPADQAYRVRVERTTGTRTASMEPNLLRLALRNLLSNALKFSPRGSPVRVRISDSDEPLAVIFDVIDCGGGIDSALLPRLFDRGDRRGRQPGGRRQGLGLYIAQRVMQLHGGAVTLESSGAYGTTMRLMIVQSGDD